MQKQLEFWQKVIYQLKEILNSVKDTLTETNPDYDIAIKRLHLYDIKLVTFGVDRKRNLIIQFPILCNHTHDNH